MTAANDPHRLRPCFGALSGATGTMHVVEDVTLRDARPRVRLGDRPVRLRQDDDDEHRRRIRAADRRSVTLDGRPIAGPGPDRGVIFQEYGVFPWLTVKQNIAFGLTLRANRRWRAERDDICNRYMELMGLSDFADAWPR